MIDTRPAERRLVGAGRCRRSAGSSPSFARDPEVSRARSRRRRCACPRPAAARRPGPQADLVDATGQVAQIRAAAQAGLRHECGEDLVDRIRDRYVPARRASARTDVFVTGAPAFGVDFVDKAYGAFPGWSLAVLVLTYLSSAARLPLGRPADQGGADEPALGRRHLRRAGARVPARLGQRRSGFRQPPQIEAWIPIFLFAMLFGLSMDYEVFLLSRMREEWDAPHDNERAVALGLERTGRIITAAAVIMIAAFSGFTAGSFVGLQEFGVGLSAAILLDATIVRAMLVPATMKLLGDWNWYLPERVRRALRLKARRARRVARRSPAANPRLTASPAGISSTPSARRGHPARTDHPPRRDAGAHFDHLEERAGDGHEDHVQGEAHPERVDRPAARDQKAGAGRERRQPGQAEQPLSQAPGHEISSSAPRGGRSCKTVMLAKRPMFK